jgi:antitoxin PrlF
MGNTGKVLEEIIIVNVTKKGQATIPKKLREKYGIDNKAVVVEEKGEGILFKPLPSPEEEFGSLKSFANGKTAHELIEESRKADYERDKRLLRLAGLPDV